MKAGVINMNKVQTIETMAIPVVKPAYIVTVWFNPAGNLTFRTSDPKQAEALYNEFCFTSSIKDLILEETMDGTKKVIRSTFT